MAEALAAEPVANGNTLHEEPAAVQPEAEVAEPTEPEQTSKGLYILRIPRPTFDDSAVKKLEGELSAVFTKLKAINGKAQIKRGEANELRKQLGVARSLRNGSSPEFDEKMTRLKQLREMRKAILDKVQEMKSGRQGLECRTEEELDLRIAEMEHSIQHDDLPLNTEKQYVRNIAKLRSQREQIRAVQGQQESLGAMEAEAKKIKAVIDEVDSEMNILRGERDQAKDIIDDLQKKLAMVTAVLNDYDLERQDLESTKRDIQEQLKSLREEIDGHMFEWRANRKLSLQLRDLVAEGKAEEASSIAEQQVENYLGKLLTDTGFRREYIKLWSEQRRYLVSELLPDSGAPEPKPAAAAGKAGDKGKGKPAAPLVPQGAMKAQAIIAAALAEADAAVAAKRLAEPQAPVQEAHSEHEEEAEEEAAAPAALAVRIVPGITDELIASSAKAARAHAKPAADKYKAVAELPEVPDYEYIMPPPKEVSAETMSKEELKARVREEQRQKAAEAELRKKRRQEQQVKKAAAAKQKAAEQAAAAASAPPVVAAGRVAAAPVADEIEGASGTDGENEAAEDVAAVQQQQQVKQRKADNKHLPAKAKQQLAAAGRKPVPMPKKAAKVQKWHQQYATELAIAGVALLMLVLMLLWFTTK